MSENIPRAPLLLHYRACWNAWAAYWLTWLPPYSRRENVLPFRRRA